MTNLSPLKGLTRKNQNHQGKHISFIITLTELAPIVLSIPKLRTLIKVDLETRVSRFRDIIIITN